MKKYLNSATEWLKQNKLLVLVIVFAAIAFFSIRGCVQSKSEKHAFEDAIAARDSKIDFWKSSDSISHAKAKTVMADKEALDILYKSQMDSISKVLGIKNKQISEYTQIIQIISGKINAPVEPIYKDSLIYINGKDSLIKVYDFSGIVFKDKWIDLKATIKKGIFDADYKVKDSLNIVGYWKKTGFLNLGKKEYYLDISSSNPNATIENVKNFRVTSAPQNKFGIGVIGGYGVNLSAPLSKPTPFVGIGVFYKLF